MPPENDELEGSPEGQPNDGDDQIDAAIAASLAQTPTSVRDTPEFRALEREYRKASRKLGSANREAQTARGEAERFRQSAEDQRLAAQANEIAAVLGDAGVEAWNEIAELSQTDPVAAARKVRELNLALAQSQPAGEPAAPPASEEGNVSNAAAPPPPSRGLDGSAPLAPAPVDDDEATITRLEGIVQGVADRNQDPAQRNRVTMRDRASAMIAFLGAGYVKGIRARNQRTQP